MSKLYVYMFRSRNKDNKHIDGFKERCKTILEYEENEDKVKAAFNKFANEGMSGETTRFYKSVNARDEDKVRKALLVKLISEEPSITKMNRILASVAQQKENASEHKWLFDFDVDDVDLMDDFLCNVLEYSSIKNAEDIIVKKTPNGYAIVVPNGFDTRGLFKHWEDYDITLKRDELLLLDWKTKK